MVELFYFAPYMLPHRTDLLCPNSIFLADLPCDSDEGSSQSSQPTHVLGSLDAAQAVMTFYVVSLILAGILDVRVHMVSVTMLLLLFSSHHLPTANHRGSRPAVCVQLEEDSKAVDLPHVACSSLLHVSSDVPLLWCSYFSFQDPPRDDPEEDGVLGQQAGIEQAGIELVLNQL
eukprot:766760-Hanusia_phi.AAC.5